MLLPKAARLRIARVARNADKALCSQIFEVASKTPGSAQVDADAWRVAFCDWVVRLFDAAAEEYLEHSDDSEDDIAAALLKGPGDWAVTRSISPNVMENVVLKALSAAERRLPAGRPPELLIPYPAIQSAVRERVGYWVGRALDYAAEEPGDFSDTDTPIIEPPASEPLAIASWPWEELKINFVSDESVIVKCPAYTGPRTFAELGFANQKNGKPVIAWWLLKQLAENDGAVSSAFEQCKNWPKVEKAAQDLRRRIKQAFRRQDDPLQTVQHGRQKGSYKARFTVLLGYSTDRSPLIELHKRRGHGPDT